MKSIFCSLVLAVIFFAGQAIATPLSFDSPAGKFSIDVPDDWTAQPDDLGCQITDDAENNSMTVQFRKADIDPMFLAQGIVKHLKGMIEKESNENGIISILCRVEKEKILIMVAPFGKFLACSIMAGPDTNKMLDLLKSLKEVK